MKIGNKEITMPTRRQFIFGGAAAAVASTVGAYGGTFVFNKDFSRWNKYTYLERIQMPRMWDQARTISRAMVNSQYGDTGAQIVLDIAQAVEDYYSEAFDNYHHGDGDRILLQPMQMFDILMMKARIESDFMRLPRSGGTSQHRGHWGIWGVFHHERHQWAIRLKKYGPDEWRNTDVIELEPDGLGYNAFIGRGHENRDELRDQILNMRGDAYMASRVQIGYINEEVIPRLTALVEQHLEDTPQARAIGNIAIGIDSIYAEHVFGRSVAADMISAVIGVEHYRQRTLEVAVGRSTARDNRGIAYEDGDVNGRALFLHEAFDHLRSERIDGWYFRDFKSEFLNGYRDFREDYARPEVTPVPES